MKRLDWNALDAAGRADALRRPVQDTAAAVAATVAHRSPGSCSTQPGCGKCWVNSRCAIATMAPVASKTMARELEVLRVVLASGAPLALAASVSTWPTFS